MPAMEEVTVKVANTSPADTVDEMMVTATKAVDIVTIMAVRTVVGAAQIVPSRAAMPAWAPSENPCTGVPSGTARTIGDLRIISSAPRVAKLAGRYLLCIHPCIKCPSRRIGETGLSGMVNCTHGGIYS
jgi:hypothetical protein